MGCSCLKGTETNDVQKRTNATNTAINKNKTENKKFENYICKINGKEQGLLCKIKNNENKNFIYVLIANADSLKEEDISIGKNIQLNLYEKNYNINIDSERKIYINKDKYNLGIIEIKGNDNIDTKTFIEIDISSQIIANQEIYLIYKNFNNKIDYNKGTIKEINKNGYEISIYLKSNVHKKIFSPILNPNNNKLIGNNDNIYSGVLIKNLIKEFLNFQMNKTHISKYNNLNNKNNDSNGVNHIGKKDNNIFDSSIDEGKKNKPYTINIKKGINSQNQPENNPNGPIKENEASEKQSNDKNKDSIITKKQNDELVENNNEEKKPNNEIEEDKVIENGENKVIEQNIEDNNKEKCKLFKWARNKRSK